MGIFPHQTLFNFLKYLKGIVIFFLFLNLLIPGDAVNTRNLTK